MAPAGALEAAYTERTANAVTALQNTFSQDAPERDKVHDIINAGMDAPEQWWHQVVLGQGQMADVSRDIRMLDPNSEMDGIEGEATIARPTAVRIQKRLSEVIDEPKIAELRKAFLDADAMEDVLRLDELHDKQLKLR